MKRHNTLFTLVFLCLTLATEISLNPIIDTFNTDPLVFNLKHFAKTRKCRMTALTWTMF